ncbi:hypothetical protein BKA19_3721 [Blastococcus saxobsidens]|uniref:Uncharacterized protein n=1 Tax=Blastococcus saxobsidens TaxID=138336 RepID=A0A4Q7YBX5_9ACTN|nr:hypothetical protein BKA19_3721 [Blastococcus saxobsidens]
MNDVTDQPRGKPLDWLTVALYYVVITTAYLPWFLIADSALMVFAFYLATMIVLLLPFKYVLRKRGYAVDPSKYRWWDYKDRSRPR